MRLVARLDRITTLPLHRTRTPVTRDTPPQTRVLATSPLDCSRLRFMVPPFLLGVVAAQHVNVVGELYLGELLGAFLLLPIILRRARLSRVERRLLFFAVLWAGAQGLSDVYNQTPPSDSLKGVFAPLVFVAAILGLTAYFRANVARMPSFLLGVAFGAMTYLAFFPTEYFAGNHWKWGVGSFVLTVFTVHYSFFLRRKSLVLLIAGLVSFVVVSLYYDSRSMAVLSFLAGAVYISVQAGMGERFFKSFAGRWGVVRLLPLIIVAAFLLNLGGTALFTTDFFLSRISPAAAQKYETQARGSFGLLLGGRSELLISYQAFFDKPLLGHGSWPKDTGGYRQAYAERYSELGYTQGNQQAVTAGLIPTHSYLMGALVWSGILGGLFWLVVLYNVAQRFLRLTDQLPLFFYIALVGFLWDVLFSPFGASARWGTAVFLAAFLAYSHTTRQGAPAQ